MQEEKKQDTEEQETETEAQPKVDPMMTGERAVKKSNNRGTPLPRGTKSEDIESGTPSYE